MKAKTIKSPLLIDTIQRYLLFIIGLFFSALGVAITKKGELGVSPISSAANVMSIRLPQLSLGYWLIIWNCVLILGQILLLRRKFQWIQLLQVPLSFLFGWFTDFGVWLISFFTPKHYVVQIFAGTGRNCGSRIRHYAGGHCKCDSEFRRGICQSVIGYHSQGIRQCENRL